MVQVTLWYTVTTRMILHADRQLCQPILYCINGEGQSHKTVFLNHKYRKERRAEADLNCRASACQPSALLLDQTSSQ